MKQDLELNGYLYVENFLSAEEIEQSVKHLNHGIEKSNNNIIDDDGIAKKYMGIRNYVPFIALQCKKIHMVSSIIEEDVMPTYCVARKYLNSSILKRHFDKPTCEISLTVNLEQDQPWNFCVQRPKHLKNDEFSSIQSKPGDAIIYLGNECFHWRENPFNGGYYSQLFLHYVRSNGKHSNLFFDLQMGRTIELIDRMKYKHHLELK